MSNPLTITPSWSDRSRTKRATLLLLVLILIVHTQGRVAAVCHPYKVDSFTYAVAAYKLWHSGATHADLVSDKPPGQALLTGWWYRLAPGKATRLTLIPVESAFLILAYLVFALIARRLFGFRMAVVLTLFYVLAFNTYNALDFTTDGFNLNENYMALPMLCAVWASTTVTSPLRRGIAAGVAVGVALTIKQSAAGLLLALLIAELVTARRERRVGRGAAAGAMMLSSVAAVFGALALYLFAHGWLAAHLNNLLHQTAPHTAPPPFTLPRWYNLSPLIPACWVGMLGIVVHLGVRKNPTHADAASPAHAEAVAAQTPADVSRRAALFITLWLAVELVMLAAMRKPSSHYYQQIAAPAVLAAGWGLAAYGRGVALLGEGDSAIIRRWAGATAVVLTLIAAMPLFAAASGRIHTFDYRAEVSEFARRIQKQSHRAFAPTEKGTADHGGS